MHTDKTTAKRLVNTNISPSLTSVLLIKYSTKIDTVGASDDRIVLRIWIAVSTASSLYVEGRGVGVLFLESVPDGAVVGAGEELAQPARHGVLVFAGRG